MSSAAYRIPEGRERNPLKDLTTRWERLNPIEDAPERILGSVEYFAQKKGFDLDALVALGTRYKTSAKGLVTLAWARHLNPNTVVGIRYRPLDPEKKRYSEPGSRFSPPVLPHVVGSREATRWIVVEGETDGARLYHTRGKQATILILGGTRGACYSEWDALYPPGAMVLVALDADERLPDDPPAVLKGEDASQILIPRLRAKKLKALRMRPPEGKDWCLA